MSIYELMSADMKRVFYNTKEFAKLAQYKGADISVIFENDVEVENREFKVISVIVEDVEALSIGDVLTIELKEYEVVNFDYKESLELEFLVALKEL